MQIYFRYTLEKHNALLYNRHTTIKKHQGGKSMEHKIVRHKAYIYTRVSTAMQVDGFSLDAQREDIQAYAKI